MRRLLFLALLVPVLAHGTTSHRSPDPGDRPSFVPPASGGGKKGKKTCDSNHGNGLTAAEEKRIIANYKTADVPYHAQDEAKCGLYALKMVMHYYHRRDSRNQNPPVNEVGEPFSEDREPIFPYARRADELWAADGETSHWNVANIAEAYGYTARSRSSAFLGGIGAPDIDDLKEEVDAGRPVLVSVRSTNAKGMPCVSDGYGGHWAVIEGWVSHDGRDYFIVKHGTAGGDVVWPVDLFEEAWRANWRGTVYIEAPY